MSIINKYKYKYKFGCDDTSCFVSDFAGKIGNI